MTTATSNRIQKLALFLGMLTVVVNICNGVLYFTRVAPSIRATKQLFAHQEAVLAGQAKLLDAFRPNDKFVIWFDDSPSERYCHTFLSYEQNPASHFITIHTKSGESSYADSEMTLVGSDSVHIAKGCPNNGTLL